MKKYDKQSILDSFRSYINIEDIPNKELQKNNILERLKNGAFISYAQNYEDVILNRVFNKQKTGFYVDVGAFHPFSKSVTCHFFKHKWNGINIDLCEENISRFDKYRPTDINICAAISNKAGSEEFFVQKGTTRTTKDKSLAEKYKNRGVEVKQEKLNVFTLSELLVEHNVEKIDFLSVDVEGAEYDVFEGINFELHRPTVILAEATYPETNIPNWEGWHSILVNADYQCVYFDGLNRFYIKNEDSHLESHFELPPNYFDNFIRYESIMNLLSNVE